MNNTRQAEQALQATEQLTTLINNVNNTQIDLQLNNAKEQYKQNIREGNLTDGYYLFGALPYELYDFFNNTTHTVDRFANVFKELYDFYLENNQEEVKSMTSLVTFILKVSNFTNDRLDPLLEDDDYQGYLPYLLVKLLMDIIIKTGTFYYFNITPVDINVIMYKNEYFRNERERFTSLAHHLEADLNQRERDDFYHRTGQFSLLSSMDF